MNSLLDELTAILKRLTPEKLQQLFREVHRTFGQSAEELHSFLLSLIPESPL